MDKQLPKSDPDKETLDMIIESLRSRNKALRKILKQLQKNSAIHSGADKEASPFNTESENNIA